MASPFSFIVWCCVAAGLQTFPAVAAPTTIPTTSATSPASQPRDASPAALPYVIERFARDGPLAGVVVRLDLSDPRVRVVAALTDDRDPDGDGPAVGRLDTVLRAAERQRLDIAMNASFFAVAHSRTVLGKQVSYYVGNGAWPVGWLRADGRTLGTPANDRMRATMIVRDDGRVTLEADVKALPADARHAVSGNAKLLTAGEALPPTTNPTADVRHPRSAVGLSADGKTLILLTIDGRRPGHSRGATLAETAALLKEFGAADGVNLDGGGSTTLVVRDPATGVHAVVNRPSDAAALVPAAISILRPVVDLVGVTIDAEGSDE